MTAQTPAGWDSIPAGPETQAPDRAAARRRLHALRNRRALYELALTHPDGRRVLLAYTDGKSRTAVLKAIRRRGPAVVSLTGSESVTFARKAADGATIGEWSVNHTGRTEREAITDGPLPYVGDPR